MSARDTIARAFERGRQSLRTWFGNRRRRFGERREVVERKRSATWQVGIAIVAVTVGAAAFGYLAVQLFFLPETVAQSRLNRVPDLTGRDVEDAIEAGEEAGYTVIETGGQFSEEVESGDVLYQIPPPQSYLQRGDTLFVLTSLGEATPVLPDLAGVEPEIARSVLARLGLEITPSRRESSDLHPQGTVIETIPPAGTPIEEGTEVTLVLSRGGSFLQMPDVTNLPLVAARDSLESFGLTVGEVTGVQEDRPAQEGVVVVVSQDPEPFDRVRAGSAVRLQLGEAPRSEVESPRVEVPEEGEPDAAGPDRDRPDEAPRSERSEPDERRPETEPSPREEEGFRPLIDTPEPAAEPGPGEDETAPPDARDESGEESAASEDTTP
ncbi:MAG: PASTA domain-containing protein [Gemmatimonadota bacterium]|nr:PASTA domain-containing protein [Gemmatimonadota bacterium]